MIFFCIFRLSFQSWMNVRKTLKSRVCPKTQLKNCCPTLKQFSDFTKSSLKRSKKQRTRILTIHTVLEVYFWNM